MTTDATDALAALRRDFPAWGILHDPFRPQWVAVRGRTETLTTASAEELRADLEREAERG